MSLTPKEIPTGAVRYNTDSNKMEVYIGDTWMEVSVSTPNLGGGAGSNTGTGTRGFAAGGSDPGYTATIDFYTIPTQGNSSDFGDLTLARGNGMAGFASRTRGVGAGGFDPTANYKRIDFVTMSSTGDATNFGSLTSNREGPMGLSNATRGIAAAGWSRPNSNNIQAIDFVTIASTGDSQNFGDLAQRTNYGAGAASPTRGLLIAGNVPSPGLMYNRIEYITIASQGDAQDFGELQQSHQYTLDGASNSTRALAWGGAGPNTDTATNVIEFITIASKGNGINFGDMTRATKSAAGATASSTRSVCLGGNSENIIEYVEIATQGNAVDFGDATSGRNNAACFSNGHGGL
tara:strand:+ start:213 stop:1256 length:1044 start_codon:yes stop_codon:yes gene_type:complete